MSEEVTGYDALNFDGLERRGNYRFIAYREDMLHALDKKDAAATIYQIVYRWQVEYKREEVLRKIDERKKSGLKPYTQEEVEDMMFVYMSYNDFVHESGGAIGYNTVIRTLDYLVDKKKALKQRPNHDPKYPDFEYSVNKEVVRELLKALPPDPAFAPKIPKKKNSSTQMGTPENEENQSTQMGIGSTQTGIPSTQMGTEVYPNGGTSQELTSNTQELTGKTSLSSSDDAPSHQSEKERELEKEVDGLKAQIAQLLQAFKDSNYPPEPPKGSASPTLAGRNNTVPDGGNSPTQEPTFPQFPTLPENQEPHVLDNAIPEPYSSATDGLVQESGVIVPPQNATPEIASESEKPLSSTQAVKGLSNQATEQGKQASDNSYSPPMATNNQPAENPPTTKKSRGGKSAAAKEEKPKKEITGSKEALAIVDMYISLFKHPIPLTQSMVDEAEKLVPCHPTSEDINGCRLWCYASNPDWYGKNGKTKGRVTMKDIVNNWAGWVASKEAPATGFQVPDELKDRVAGVYAALNEWRASKTGDAENVFVPDVESDQAICNLLQKGKRPTKKRMNAVCEAIWETPRNAKTGYLQREHMTIKMICLTYREREIDIVAKEKEQEIQGPKNIVDLFDANRTFGNGLTYLPGALPVVAKSSVVMEG